jgi:hypothetical protein
MKVVLKKIRTTDTASNKLTIASETKKAREKKGVAVKNRNPLI